MKKFLLSLAVAVAALGAKAVSERATLVTLGTTGPDTYADGSTVMDGETYALVWTRNGSSFAGFNLDGTLVDANASAVLYSAARAKGGAFPTMTFAIDAAVLDALNGSGTLALHMLDTRRFIGGVATTGGAVQGSRAVVGGGVGFLPSALAGGAVPEPTISAIRVENDEIVLTLANAVPEVNYSVTGGSDLSNLGETVSKAPVTACGTVEIRVPKTKNAAFFRARRN